MSSTVRPYQQVARAAATERTQQRVVAVFLAMLKSQWLDEITLDAVAAAADTTRQTVIRLFGGKDGLLAAAAILARDEILGRRHLPDGTPPASLIATLVADYEIDGDMVVRLLAQEPRHPDLVPFLDMGRAGHRAWLAGAFATTLAALPPPSRDTLLDEVVAVTDVYVWKLFRRDFGHSTADVSRLMTRLLQKVLSEKTP